MQFRDSALVRLILLSMKGWFKCHMGLGVRTIRRILSSLADVSYQRLVSSFEAVFKPLLPGWESYPGQAQLGFVKSANCWCAVGARLSFAFSFAFSR